MDECRSVAKFILLSTFIGLAYCASVNTEANLLNIVDDVIPDVENSTQKVIRVNTVDLPPILPSDNNASDSSLYNIKTLMLPPTYLSSKQFRKHNNSSKIGDSPIFKHIPELKPVKAKRPKQKHLQFVYNQKGYDGRSIGKRMKVRVAPGAYPIYYIVAKMNGQFRKKPIKAFHNEQELEKYFQKTKNIDKFRTR